MYLIITITCISLLVLTFLTIHYERKLDSKVGCVGVEYDNDDMHGKSKTWLVGDGSPDSLKIYIEECYEGTAQDRTLSCYEKDLQGRIKEYFIKEQPYLNHNFSITDLSEVLYSNRLYVSRSIKSMSGMNFCRFVNLHRVLYAMQLYESDPTLRVYRLSELSGFNSMTSFQMAFKIAVHQNPSEWMRNVHASKEKMTSLDFQEGQL